MNWPKDVDSWQSLLPLIKGLLVTLEIEFRQIE